MSDDTPPPTWKAGLERYRRLTPGEKLRRAFIVSAVGRAQARKVYDDELPHGEPKQHA